MGDDTDTEDKVIELPVPLDYLPEAVRQQMQRMARDGKAEPAADGDKVVTLPACLAEAASRRQVRPPAEPRPDDDGSPELPAMFAPLPLPGDAYTAHARIANGPLTTLFLLPKGGLPRGFAYHSQEEVSMIEAEKPGSTPDLLLVLGGLRPKEVRIEGRNLLALCDYLGRHLIHWLREHPTGRDDGDVRAVFIRRIAIREMGR